MAPFSNKLVSPLTRQLLLRLGVSLSLIGCIAFYLVFSLIHRLSEQDIASRARQVAEGIEFAAEGLIEIDDSYLLDRLVQNYATWPLVVEVSIISPDGQVLAHSHETSWHLPSHRKLDSPGIRYEAFEPSLAPLFNNASTTGDSVATKTQLHGQSVVVYVLPFSSSLFSRLGYASPAQVNRRGAIIAVMSRKELIENTYSVALTLVGTLLAIAIITLVVMASVIQRLVLTPLASLRQSLLHYNASEPYSAPPLPPNEIGFLGDAFIQTFEQLRYYQEQALKSAEQKYIEIAQRYELASRATRVWLWEWEMGSDIIKVDVGLLNWLKYDSESSADGFVDCRDFFIVDGDRPLFWQHLHQGSRGEEPEFSDEFRLKNAQGQHFWGLLRGQRYIAADNQPQRIVGTITDITDRKLYEEKLHLANQSMERATRLKDEFLANMSHELRTPLNAILGMTEGLQEQVYGEINPKQLYCLETIETSGKHLLALINDILDLSKIEADKFELALTPTAIAELCTTSLAFVKQFAHQKNIALTCHIPEQLPAIVLDERRMRQVLINLLNNAVKFTPEGGQVTLVVTQDVAPTAAQTKLRIEVQDTGIGIAPADVNKLFEPFMQIDSALNRRYQGTGLGLSLVKKIVELHDGSVGVISQPQQGSCFFVTLPYRVNDFHPLAALPHDDSSVHQRPIPSPLPRLLLLQGQMAQAHTLVSYLQAKGYPLDWVTDFPTAIAHAQAMPPDIIIVDSDTFSHGQGWDLTSLRCPPNRPEIPMIALADQPDPPDSENGDRPSSDHFDGWVTKPIRLNRLVATIQQLSQRQG